MITKLENSVNFFLSNNIIKYGLVLALVLLTANVKSLSYKSLEVINSNLYLIILGLIVVYLVYVDFVLAVSLTLVIIVCIQEYNSRKYIITKQESNIDTGVDDKLNYDISSNNNTTKTLYNNSKFNSLIPPSSYGSDLIYPDKNNTDEILEYAAQIGQLSPEKDIPLTFSDADDKYQTIAFNKIKKQLNKEYFNTNYDNIENKIYDHPASKTMTEMLRLKSVSLVNDEIFSKLQNNLATNLNELTPCAVESVSSSMNAQSF